MTTKLIKSVITLGFAFALVAQANDPSAMNSGENSSNQPSTQSDQSSEMSNPQFGRHGSESSTKMNSDTIRQAQEALADQGFDVKADGKMGPRTKRAIREFQSENSLPKSGRLDRETLAALGVSSGESGTSGAGQQPAPSGTDNQNMPSDTGGNAPGSSGSGTSDMNQPSDNSDNSNQGSPSDSGTSGTGSDTDSGSSSGGGSY